MQGERPLLPTLASPGCDASPLPFQFKANSYNETLMLHLFISISNLLNTVSTHAVAMMVVALGRDGRSSSDCSHSWGSDGLPGDVTPTPKKIPSRVSEAGVKIITKLSL